MTKDNHTNKTGSGDWYKQLTPAGMQDLTDADSPEALALGKGGPLVEEAQRLAQDRVSSFTMFLFSEADFGGSDPLGRMRPASGVLVRVNGMHGILTAAHVLRRDNNTPQSVEVTVSGVAKGCNKHERGKERLVPVTLTPRRVIAEGFWNKWEQGPDLAILPIYPAEMEQFKNQRQGLVAYNLQKEHLTREVVAGLRPSVRFFALVDGFGNAATRTVRKHTHPKGAGQDLRMTRMAFFTQIHEDEACQRDGHDYLDIPAVLEDTAPPAQWEYKLPGRAAEEIEVERRRAGAAQEMWAGMSGAGVWKIAMKIDAEGRPTGEPLAELAGIVFYAQEEKGCLIAHGSGSIERMASAYRGCPELVVPPS